MSLISLDRVPVTAASHALGRQAVAALYAELVLYPKPGLVSLVDSGAHDDMDATTFHKSLFTLRHYFVRIAAAGAVGLPFEVFPALGIAAEKRMMQAMGGINTHRGAIFLLGWLTAAAGWRQARGLDLQSVGLVETLLSQWGAGIANAGKQSSDSHGSRAVRRYGITGARDELLNGLPTLQEAVLPVLYGRGDSPSAKVQALFAAMERLDDTTLVHRGGPQGLAFVQAEAQAFLVAGGVDHPQWQERALALHRAFIERRLSPGGSADMVAAGCFVAGLQP